MPDLHSSFEDFVSVAVKHDVVYLYCDPPITDFLKEYTGKMVIQAQNAQAEIAFGTGGFDTFVGVLHNSVFDESRSILTWDIKALMSYIKHRKGVYYCIPSGNIIDLKYGVMFSGNRIDSPPKTFEDALLLSKSFITNKGWAVLNEYVFQPLSLEVLPKIETAGVVDIKSGEVVYSWYEIEGQVNGRLSAQKPSERYFPVHSMSSPIKANLRPRKLQEADRHVFLLFDYKNMEVNMLHWLTNDLAIESLLSSGRDFYEAVAIECWPKGSEGPSILPAENRRIGKLIFLPTMYGAAAAAIAPRIEGASIEFVSKVMQNVKEMFSKSYLWLSSKVDELDKNPIGCDFFGRYRDFSKESHYKRRNFEIQAPAAMVCLEKLCELARSPLLMHIHDGYVLTCPVTSSDKYGPHKYGLSKLVQHVRAILEGPSKLCPGLELKTSLKVGGNLNDLETIYQ